MHRASERRLRIGHVIALLTSAVALAYSSALFCQQLKDLPPDVLKDTAIVLLDVDSTSETLPPTRYGAPQTLRPPLTKCAKESGHYHHRLSRK